MIPREYQGHFPERLYWRVEALEKEAWEIFKRFDDQAFSFTDCTSFVTMQGEGITTAFAFDRGFLIAGFQVLPIA